MMYSVAMGGDLHSKKINYSDDAVLANWAWDLNILTENLRYKLEVWGLTEVGI